MEVSMHFSLFNFVLAYLGLTLFSALFLFVIFILFYFLPTIVGCALKRMNICSVFLINLFFGWTVIGWLVSLSLAATAPEINVQIEKSES
ncbi:MAG: superinfection immunity protein, partial [Candidatus Parvarchaeota archaeon]